MIGPPGLCKGYYLHFLCVSLYRRTTHGRLEVHLTILVTYPGRLSVHKSRRQLNFKPLSSIGTHSTYYACNSHTKRKIAGHRCQQMDRDHNQHLFYLLFSELYAIHNHISTRHTAASVFSEFSNTVARPIV